MKASVIGFPRIGEHRELKFTLEKYFKKEISELDLQSFAQSLRNKHWNEQKEHGIDFISSNDFSFYDNVLDTAVLFNVIPNRFKELNLSAIDTYLAMARGYQSSNGDVKALAMKKWFNTNYHYIVPEVENPSEIELVGCKPFEEFNEAKKNGLTTRPTIIGIFTFLNLCRFFKQEDRNVAKTNLIKGYQDLLSKLENIGAQWISFEEPWLVRDLDESELAEFTDIYNAILEKKGSLKVNLQTYFGDVRDAYNTIISLPFDGIGLDFLEGRKSLSLIEKNGFPEDKILFAGLVNGKNIWRNSYSSSLGILRVIKEHTDNIVISTSCSLLHVPYTLKNENKLAHEYKIHFSYAKEKLNELSDLKILFASSDIENSDIFKSNCALFADSRNCTNLEVQKRVAAIKPDDFNRLPLFKERTELQHKLFNLPLFPTTTIGSFPQTSDVKRTRFELKQDKITSEEYCTRMQNYITKCIKQQEELDIDVLVHGEFERNDMVEYFGQNLNGFLFTENGWVQSYGTRCVKPPVIWGDVSRRNPITVEWTSFAQSQTNRIMKGMLTGPVTILNWSFPREDISIKESTFQIALAIRDEVLDLENAGIKIIQVDEAALREKLPIRKSDWFKEYLDWAILAFRLVHSGVKAETQIHTHMCYSEFTDIIPSIDNMDADVITFEASRSDLTILSSLQENNFRTEVGPGVYDIHSPRVPTINEIKSALKKMLQFIPKEKLWINPDCGLKTRGNDETWPSLKNMVIAAKELRNEYQ